MTERAREIIRKRERNEMRLAGKSAIVTGAGQGIGAGIATVFAREGASLLIADIDDDAARKTATKIRDGGGNAQPIGTDVTKVADLQAMADAAMQHFGRIDILCCNVGIYPESPIEDMPADLWDKVMAVNLRSAFLSLKACLPQMKRQSWGRVVITSSITGNRTAMPDLSHYAASKGGLNGFIRAAAFEVARHNITVNGVEPGIIDTEGLRAAGPELIAQAREILPLGIIGEADDVGHAMAFLASEEAKFITGQTIVVDGGQTLSEFQSLVPKPIAG